MKAFPITIGIDDAKFDLKSDSEETYLIGAVCQGTRLVNVLRTTIEIDGNDATDAIISLIKQTEKHIQFVLTDSITFGGFNIINLDEIFSKTSKPIIAVTETNVNLDAVNQALLKRFPNLYKVKVQNIIDAGNLFESEIITAGGSSKIFFHIKGISLNEVETLFEKICIDSKAPEPIRIAHIIGKMF